MFNLVLSPAKRSRIVSCTLAKVHDADTRVEAPVGINATPAMTITVSSLQSNIAAAAPPLTAFQFPPG
jgi:hypothetical protein